MKYSQSSQEELNKDKTKIGILTYYNVHNYGAVLQMYALTKWLRDNGFKVEIIKFVRNYYHNSSENIKKYDLTLRSVPYYVQNTFNIGIRRTVYNFIKYLKLKKFKEKETVSGKYYYEYKQGELDYIIIGSDEVFALDLGFNPWFYGIGIKADNIFSYAGSFGKTNWEDIDGTYFQKEIKEGLKNFSAVSVRDKNSEIILNRLGNQNVSLVCDPVFLYGFTKNIRERKRVKKPYLLLYSYDKNFNGKEEVDCVRQFAKEHNLKIISVGYYHKWCDKNIMPDVLKLFEWFQNAQYIITDTFHGAVISILVKGKFAVLVRDNKNKLQFLLEEYSLAKRYSREVKEIVKILDTPIEYEVTNELLQQSVKQSKYFLQKNLEGAQNE